MLVHKQTVYVDKHYVYVDKRCVYVDKHHVYVDKHLVYALNTFWCLPSVGWSRVYCVENLCILLVRRNQGILLCFYLGHASVHTSASDGIIFVFLF